MEDRCTLTYIIKYKLVEKDDTEAKERNYNSEVKKVATLVRSEDIWKISDVSNVKTFIDGKDAIEVFEPNSN